MTLAATMFLKNENKYVYGPDDQKPEYTMLEQQLMFLESFVDAVYILDNKSTDGSVEVYERFRKSGMNIYWEEVEVFDEQKWCARLLELVKADNHSWMLSLDGDEILEDSARKWIINLISEPTVEKTTVRFNYINLWRCRDKYRTDDWYNMLAGKMFRVLPELTSYGKAFNNHHYAYSSTQEFGRILVPDLKVLHYAWVDWENIVSKVHRNIIRETDSGRMTLEKATKECIVVLNENGLNLSNVDKSWQEEFRSSKIAYEKIKI